MAGMPTIFLCLSKGLPMRRALNKRCDTILAHHLRGDHCMSIAIVAHGGAGTITPERAEIAQAGCKEAAQIGWRVLENGGCALDAVEAAVRALENNHDYNAGTGSCLTADGRIELDAGIMEERGYTSEQSRVSNSSKILFHWRVRLWIVRTSCSWAKEHKHVRRSKGCPYVPLKTC